MQLEQKVVGRLDGVGLGDEVGAGYEVLLRMITMVIFLCNFGGIYLYIFIKI
jgi:hypothetical protein